MERHRISVEMEQEHGGFGQKNNIFLIGFVHHSLLTAFQSFQIVVSTVEIVYKTDGRASSMWSKKGIITLY